MLSIRLSATALAAVALYAPGCTLDHDLDHGPEELATDTAAVINPHHLMQKVKTLAEDQALGARLLAAGRIKAPDTSWQQLAATGTLNASGRICRLSAGLHNYLDHLLRIGKRLDIQSLARPSSRPNPHGLDGDQVVPAISECVVIAMDVGRWEGKTVDIVHPDEALAAMTDILASLPPGQFTLGVLRSPYPSWHSRSADDAHNYRALPGVFANGTTINHLAHYRFMHSDWNEVSPCNEIAGDKQRPSAEAFPPGAPRHAGYPHPVLSPPPPEPCRNGFDELRFIADPVARHQLTEAYAGATLRRVTANFYGDALNHVHIAVEAAEDVRPLARADMDADGLPDRVFARSDGTVELRTIGGADKSVALPDVDVAVWKLVTHGVDFDGDRQNDILWYNRTNGVKSVWFMNGSRIRRHQEWPSLGGFDPLWDPVAAGDLDGNGKPEILWRYWGNDDWAVFSIDGHAIAPGVDPYIRDVGLNLAGVADVNRDGKDDLSWYDPVTLLSWVWQMNGMTVELFDYYDHYAVNWSPSGMADFDRNGVPDVAYFSTHHGGFDPTEAPIDAGVTHYIYLMGDRDPNDRDGTRRIGRMSGRWGGPHATWASFL